MAYEILGVGRDTKTVKGQRVGVLTGIFYGAPERYIARLIAHDPVAFEVTYRPFIESIGREYDDAVIRILVRANLCPMATKGCAGSCLFDSGMAAFCPNVKPSRVRRTILFLLEPDRFFEATARDLGKLERKAKREGYKPAARLNGTTDIRWERYGLIADHPTIDFYDYTKFTVKSRAKALDLDNYWLTYSHNEGRRSWSRAVEWLDAGRSAAVVFRTPAMVAQAVAEGFRGYPVVDGDEHDARFRESGVVVALKAKGPAKKDQTGFVIDL